jgi:chaperonin GroES
MDIIFKVLGERVLIKRAEVESKKGTIIISPSSEKKNEGEIVSVGSSCKNVSVGDMVMFNKYGSLDVKIEEVDYLIVNESEILGIL